MIHSVIPTSCIKGNPVRNRNSARYCKATLLRLLVAATEHTENILQNNTTVLQTAVGESKHQFEPSQTGDGKVSFSVGLSQETCLGNYTVNAFPGSGRQVLILHFSINENQLFIGSHTVLPDTPAPCPNRIERKGGERRHERASCRGKYPRRQQSDGMHHQRKRRIYHRQSARRTTHAALLLHRLHPQKIHRGRTRRKHPCKAGGELQQPQPGGSDRNRYAPPHDRQPRSRIRNHSQRNRQRQRIYAGRSAGEADAQYLFLHQRHGHYHEPERHQRGLHTDIGKRQTSGW